MKSLYNTDAPKRPVNLSLNEDLLVQARGLTDNLSGVVENLLAAFVAHERGQRLSKDSAIQATVMTWNKFNSKHGAFADDYSTL